MQRKPELLYLDLMKKTLSFTLWPEPPVPVDIFLHEKPFYKKLVILFISRLFKPSGLLLAMQPNFTTEQRENGMIWPGYADTMIGLKRLDNLQFCIETVLREHIKGDMIETGVWRGGACIFMRAVLAAYDVHDRRVFVADSFRGLPKPDKRYPADRNAQFHIHRFLAVSRAEVERNFRKYDLLDDNVVFLEGWFKDTLPTAPIERLSILRLDGDMYSSTMEALTNLYPKLSDGGFCIVDDYALAGCRDAIDDFRKEHSIASKMEKIDYTGVFWRK